MSELTTEQRRKIMRQVKSKNTLPEKILMKALKEKGIYFTKHCADVIGKPDIVFKRKKIAIFVDSDFWHGKAHTPQKNQDYWIPKLERNRKRDEFVNSELTNSGWLVLRFTENEIKKNPTNCVEQIIKVKSNR